MSLDRDEGMDEVHRLTVACARAIGPAPPHVVAGVIVELLAMTLAQFEEREWSGLLQDVVRGVRAGAKAIVPAVAAARARKMATRH